MTPLASEESHKMYGLVCKARFDAIEKKLDTILRALFGDAETSGLLLRIDRLEQRRLFADRLAWMFLGALVPLIVAAILGKIL